MNADGSEAPATGHGIVWQGRDPRYLRMLLLLIVAASFFVGYDENILNLLPTEIQDTFGLTVSGLAWMRFVIQLGAVIAFVVAASADRVGRRPILLWSVVGYTVFTGVTAFAWNVVVFTVAQFFAKIFLSSEYAVSVTIISEEFPPHRRGRALGTFSLMESGGALLVPILALTPLLTTKLEWRAFYLVGLIPLTLLIWLRRRIKETRLFEERRRAAAAAGEKHMTSIWEPWRGEHRFYMVVLALVTFMRSFPIFAAINWWVWYAEREAGLDQAFIFAFFIVAFTLGIVGYYVCGRLIDRVGRKPTLITFALVAWVATTVLFQTKTALLQGIFLVFAVFFGLGMAPALNAFYTELFPTRLRASAASWARNAFEIPGLIVGPLVVGILGDHGAGAIGGVGDAMVLTLGLLPTVAVLVWRYLPETKGRHLEELDVAEPSTGSPTGERA